MRPEAGHRIHAEFLRQPHRVIGPLPQVWFGVHVFARRARDACLAREGPFEAETRLHPQLLFIEHDVRSKLVARFLLRRGRHPYVDGLALRHLAAIDRVNHGEDAANGWNDGDRFSQGLARLDTNRLGLAFRNELIPNVDDAVFQTGRRGRFAAVVKPGIEGSLVFVSDVADLPGSEPAFDGRGRCVNSGSVALLELQRIQPDRLCIDALDVIPAFGQRSGYRDALPSIGGGSFSVKRRFDRNRPPAEWFEAFVLYMNELQRNRPTAPHIRGECDFRCFGQVAGPAEWTLLRRHSQ